jgi:alkylhydroperoxidase family enzyme
MSTAARVTAPPGKSGNLIRDSALGLVEDTLAHYLPLNAAIWDSGPLSPADIEIARLRSAQHVGCVFCQAVRYREAIAAGLDESKVVMIDDGFSGSELSEREKLIIAFTDQYLHDPAPPGDTLQAKLESAFSVPELVHLSLAIAYFNGFSRCAVALGGMPDSMPRTEINVPR